MVYIKVPVNEADLADWRRRAKALGLPVGQYISLTMRGLLKGEVIRVAVEPRDVY